jgi:ribosomal protein S1
MGRNTLTGKITFIHHDKNFVTIEYTQNGKTKDLSGNIDEKEQLRLKAEKAIKKVHQFHIGDEVSFIIVPTPRGDKMMATHIQFLYNNALDTILQKAAIENRVVGYLKKVDDNYFVKETSSYILFPLILSPWEIPPNDNSLNEPVFFKLDHIDKGAKSTASLFRSTYIPEYMWALKVYKNKEVIQTVVYKVTPYGIFVNIGNGGKIQAKIPLKKDEHIDAKIGDNINIIITYLGHTKIVVERV